MTFQTPNAKLGDSGQVFTGGPPLLPFQPKTPPTRFGVRDSLEQREDGGSFPGPTASLRCRCPG